MDSVQENKFKTIVLATIGGVNAVFDIAVPILVALLWVRYSNMLGVSSYVLVGAGIISSIFRGIKVGWLKG